MSEKEIEEAKVEAKEIYNKFIDILNIKNDMRSGANPFAKECALYSISKMITYSHEFVNDLFLIEVQKQINAL